jgi:deoxycytidylate deaminase
MTMRFVGELEELKLKLAGVAGEWRQLNPSQMQFRARSGGILNWYPATGALMFQGKSPALEKLHAAVFAALGMETPDAPPPTASTAAPTPLGQPVSTELRSASIPGSSEDRAPIDDRDGAPVFLERAYSDSELVLGLIGAVGTELEKVRDILEERLRVIGYAVTQVRITKDVIPEICGIPLDGNGDEHSRLKGLMDAGNAARAQAEDNSILALGAVAYINSRRRMDLDKASQHEPRRAYIISSLKHPEEVARLREIYPEGFYLIGVHADEKRRFGRLTEAKRIAGSQASELMVRDEEEQLRHGQRVADTFHLSDFFVRIDGSDDCLRNSLWRVLDLLFGDPYVTPTFDEYAMFLAFAASLSSADLSRQVGAVVAVDQQVVATGANDCPKASGGRYWPEYDKTTHRIEDRRDGRDYKRGDDSNKIEQQKIIDDILDRAASAGLDREKLEAAIKDCRIRDLTEFGRVVHAEMDALLSCTRASISTKEGTVYTTTFPCHNCAKHIVAAGIRRVVFIEPYQKSKAAEFHTDSIRVGLGDPDASQDSDGLVRFEPFVGVGPRRFFDLFSVRLGSGYPLSRKDRSGHVIEWKPEQARLRLQMLPVSYLDLELIASNMFRKACESAKEVRSAE